MMHPVTTIPALAKTSSPLNSAIGIVAVFVPGSLYLLNSRQKHVLHNDHEGQKSIHTSLTHVEKSKKAGVGGKLHGIDELVTTNPDDVEHHLPKDALNHPVNREKVCSASVDFVLSTSGQMLKCVLCHRSRRQCS